MKVFTHIVTTLTILSAITTTAAAFSTLDNGAYITRTTLQKRMKIVPSTLTTTTTTPFVSSLSHFSDSAFEKSSSSSQLYNSATTVGSSDSNDDSNKEASSSSSSSSIDIVLMIYFALWFAGNYFYKVTNKLALNAAGGKTGFPMTISCAQLGVGSVYALLTWLPKSSRPNVTRKDLIKMIPVAFCFLGSHSASIFAFSAGAVSFGEIVKAAEPVFSAVLSQFAYNRPVSKAKWLCLPIVIGGVIMASVKELGFTWTALIAGCIANLFAAFKGNENKKLIEKDGIKDRIGSVRNQFALTTILAFFLSIPFMIIKEGYRLNEFIQYFNTSNVLKWNILLSALWYYNYNDIATRTLKKTGPVTSSVANTAKRVLVIVGTALRLGEALPPSKLIGSSICVIGVFLYSIIDKIIKPKNNNDKADGAIPVPAK